MVTLLNCIERIPGLIKDAVNKYPSQFINLKEKEEIKKIMFIASGSSYNAAFISKNFLEDKCGIKVELMYPNEFRKTTILDTLNTLYVFISQSGTTKLVYEDLLRAKSEDCVTLSITSDINTPIALASDYAIDAGCGHEEFRYRTIGVSTTIVMCWLLGCYLSGNKDYKSISIVANQLEQMIENTLNWYQKNKFELMRRNKVMFTGSGTLWPIGIEADIKFMEMIPYLTKTYELEEFMHGPQNAFDDQIVYFVLSNKDIDEEKTIAMANFLKKEIGICYMVGNAIVDECDFNFTIDTADFFELKYLTFFQVVSYLLSIDHGRDLNKGLNTSITKYLSKSL